MAKRQTMSAHTGRGSSRDLATERQTRAVSPAPPVTGWVFPKNIEEIKLRREQERRPKPQVKGDPNTPKLGPKFKLANKEQVPHAHHEDLDPGSGPSPDKMKLNKLLKGPLLENVSLLVGKSVTEKDLIDGLFALDEIFNWIVGETSRRLDKVNQALAAFNEAENGDQSTAQEKYAAATNDFYEFVNKLNNSQPDREGYFGATINAANIEPILNGGYYTSARVVIQWLGGTHSGSSLVHVP